MNTNVTPTVSVILPAYNEAENIGQLVTRIKQLHPSFEVIVVDDGSTDETSNVALLSGATVFQHPYNIGNGAAVKTGIRKACGDYLVFMDSDGQHAPEDIKELIAFLPKYDMVVGARTKNGQANIGRAFGNRLYNLMASYVAKFDVRDLTSGFRALKRDIALNYLYLLPNTYSYPTTITLGVLRSGNTLKYVDIEVSNRKRGKSNIRFVRDGIRFFIIIVKICTLYSPFRVFLPVSAGLFLTGILYYFYTFIIANRFTNMGVLLLSTAAIIFMMGLVSEQICQMRFERRAGDIPSRRLADQPVEDKTKNRTQGVLD